MPTKILPNGFRLGCNPSSPSDLVKRPYMAYYMRNVPDGPPVCQRTLPYKNWGKKLNDQYGCCVVSGKVHFKQATSFLDAEGAVNDIPDAEVRRVYFMLSPGDNGLNIDDFITWCQSQPMPWTLGPSGTVGPNDRQTLCKCLWWLGGVTLGIGVPREWGNNPQNGFVWDRVGHFEGVVHDVQAVDYNQQGVEIITWGLRGTITWAGLVEQCGEAHAILAPDWYGQDGVSKVTGLATQELHNYLAEITGQDPPYPNPVPPTPVPPVPVPPGPSPVPPTPVPSPDNYCAQAKRGISVLKRGMEIAEANPSDTRVQTALDWLEGWLA